MWRGALLSTLCLIACHRPPAPPPEAPSPTVIAARGGESALTPAPDARGPVAPRPPPAATEPRASGPDKPEAEARCTRDEDCALTQLAPEECCPQCTPRALSTAALARLQRSCSHVPESSCPMPACRPPPGVPSAACTNGQCTVRFTSME